MERETFSSLVNPISVHLPAAMRVIQVNTHLLGRITGAGNSASNELRKATQKKYLKKSKPENRQHQVIAQE